MDVYAIAVNGRRQKNAIRYVCPAPDGFGAAQCLPETDLRAPAGGAGNGGAGRGATGSPGRASDAPGFEMRGVRLWHCAKSIEDQRGIF